MSHSIERFVDVPGGRLFAIEEGEGPQILLLHAGIADQRAWEPLVARLVPAGFRTIRYDLRGFGRSETDQVPFSNRADAIAILDAFGIGRACLVGNSRGGQVAIDTTIEYPDRVAALVTLGAGIGGLELPIRPEEEVLFEEAERVEEAGDPGAIAAFDTRIWGDGPGQPEGRLPGDLRDRLLEMARAAADPDRTRGEPVPLDPPAAERFEGIAVPVLAIAGALDVSDTLAVAERLGRLPGGRAVVIPGVAHMIAMEAPDAVADLIIATLRPPAGTG